MGWTLFYFITWSEKPKVALRELENPVPVFRRTPDVGEYFDFKLGTLYYLWIRAILRVRFCGRLAAWKVSGCGIWQVSGNISSRRWIALLFLPQVNPSTPLPSERSRWTMRSSPPRIHKAAASPICLMFSSNFLNLNLGVSIQKGLESYHLNPHPLPRVN